MISDLLSLLLGILTLFIHCSSDFGEHLYDCYFEFSYQVNHLSQFIKICFWLLSCSFVWNIPLFLHFP